MNVSRRSARGPSTETEAYGVTKANAPMRNEAVAKARSNGDATRERTAETMPTAHHPIAEATATMPSASSVRAMGRRGQRSHGSQEGKMVSVFCSVVLGLQTFKVRRRVRSVLMITVRNPGSIYQVDVPIDGGSCHGRWHFSFDRYYDPEWVRFGTLRVFNDDTLTPGAIWPLHPHREIEVVTYCARGEFRHADENGAGGVLKDGWAQHTTVGEGMWHSEINNRKDAPIRFIQMWSTPSAPGLEPSVEQRAVEKADRTNRFLPLVSNEDREGLTILSDARVLSSFLEAGKKISHPLEEHRGAYLSVLGGGPVRVNEEEVPSLGAVTLLDESELSVRSEGDAELLLADVLVLEDRTP